MAGCAASGGALAPDRRVYAVDAALVIPAATEALAEAGLEIDQQRWTTDTTYVIDGHERSDFLRAGGEGVQVAEIQLVITRHADGQTAVAMETSQRERPGAASSADRDDPAVRRFFARLDRKLGR
ncbi:MAG: hypothetical protein R3247_09200 [Rhodothermales bacterium]|nr:hypothetical protein [Rhodothermales bacterium]